MEIPHLQIKPLNFKSLKSCQIYFVAVSYLSPSQVPSRSVSNFLYLAQEMKTNMEGLTKQFGNHLIADLPPLSRSRASSMNEE